mmetsp:Transcript_8746/g.10023  ORF Transcript_8746/g.10023 Transcript_8746/m.10023 type:complete len:89 (+) Transcript_8746:544-810(+)
MKHCASHYGKDVYALWAYNFVMTFYFDEEYMPKRRCVVMIYNADEKYAPENWLVMDFCVAQHEVMQCGNHFFVNGFGKWYDGGRDLPV